MTRASEYYQNGSIQHDVFLGQSGLAQRRGPAPMSVFTKRLREGRLRARMSQKDLGIKAGLDPASASTRMNRYELGKRVPHPDLVEKLAIALGVPVEYFYAREDDTSTLLLSMDKRPKRQQAHSKPTLRLALAKKIRQLRVERNWSQEELAERAGLHRNYLGGIERGERNVSVDNIEKIAEAFGLNAFELFL